MVSRCDYDHNRLLVLLPLFGPENLARMGKRWVGASRYHLYDFQLEQIDSDAGTIEQGLVR